MLWRTRKRFSENTPLHGCVGASTDQSRSLGQGATLRFCNNGRIHLSRLKEASTAVKESISDDKTIDLMLQRSPLGLPAQISVLHILKRKQNRAFQVSLCAATAC
ncbi:hypothetical protein WP8S18E04_24590 [Aeromonas caviae]|jgi:hypothetical protein|nr:hypothetical protein HMPREF1308_04946 [Klebsiella pneumoniae subsp. pneumoniae WGLW5]ERP00232.1 hypothetical protein L360_04684 [Enterobacter sp. MGH 14]ERW78828.1 hypothetical protein Q019_04141 [Pseudomonas aeruginosa BWHPSA006]ESM86855.1 hypothetical protein L380_01077 [Enterobacter roggenkampii MGH 34]EUM74110.1 hypothetical protein L353_08705 [Enterobacter sp. MGH 7]KQJ67145.1 hypothetical protein AN400_01935 [Pseudomonas aeruginosa]BBT67075.1 hypothetical protein WP8S18E04_24590 [Aer